MFKNSGLKIMTLEKENKQINTKRDMRYRESFFSGGSSIILFRERYTGGNQKERGEKGAIVTIIIACSS